MASTDLTAQTAAGEQPPYELTAEKMMLDNLLILGLLFFIFYFILIRPQQKRVRAHQDMVKGLQKGNRVITSGGLIGVISKFEGDDVAVLEVAPNTKVRVTRASIAGVRDNSVGVGDTANDN